jgi:hypothetical protein
VAVAGCGSGGPTGLTANPTIADTRAAVPVGDRAVATGTGERLYVNVGSDGHGKVLTRVAVFRPTGKARSVSLLPGSWSLPAAVPGQAEGISWDGSRAVVVSTEDPGRFVALSTAGPHVARRIVAPRGRYLYDGVSVDGSRLFLTQRADEHGVPGYRVMRYDLQTGVLDPHPIVDKLEGETVLVGEPVARAITQDFLYTVYENGTRPFVHALDSNGNFALCLDLPAEHRAAARTAWSARRLSSNVATIWNAVLHSAYRLDAGQLTPIPYTDAVE